MARIVVSEFVTLDGVMEDPGGAEGFDRGGWALRFDRGPEGDRFKLDETLTAAALLLGRRTYEGFAEAWPGRTDEAGFADRMNSMPKFVVSSTLQTAEWSSSTILRGDVAAEVTRLRQELDGDILVAGSCQLVNALMRADLVDEYRLMVFPIVLGSGRRLFSDVDRATSLRLVESKSVGNGVLILRYHPAAR